MSRFLSVLFFVFGFLFSASWALGQQSIRLGTLPLAANLPIYAAMANGYFKAEGIKFDLRYTGVGGGVATMSAIVGGSLEMGTTMYNDLCVARERGFDFVVITPLSTVVPGKESSAGSAIVVRADSGIKDPKDLEGKKIAVASFKSGNYLYAAEWMSRKGANPKGVHWLELPFPKMVSALRHKIVDAVYTVEPFITLEVERGGVNILSFPFYDVHPNMEIHGVVASENWAKVNRDLIERFARAIDRGRKYINAQPAKSGEIVGKYTRLKPELVQRMKLPGFLFPINVEAVQATCDLTLKWGLLKKKQNVKDFVWPTALK